jgi:hypothetical protein
LLTLLKGSSPGLPSGSRTVPEPDLSPNEYDDLMGDLGFDVQAALFSHAGTGFGFILLPVDIIGP